MSKTAMYDLHMQSRANIVDFFGWRLPMHFGSQIDEHLKVRSNAGMFDVSHMSVTDVSGKNAQAFLRQLLTCDVGLLTTVGQAKYCLLLNEEGGIIDDLIVYLMPDGYRIVSNCGTRARVRQWLETCSQRLEMKVMLDHRDDLSIIAAQGPKAFTNVFQVIYTKYEGTKDFGLLHHHFEYAKTMAPFTSRVLGDIHLSRTGYTGEDGVELILPHKLAVKLWQDLLDIGLQPCGLGARDTLRLEAGMALYGQDMDEDSTPREARLNWTLDLTDLDRDFIGRKPSQAREMRFKSSAFIIPKRGIPRHGQEIFVRESDQVVGTVTSGTYSPSLELGIGYCRLPVNTTDILFAAAIRRNRQPIELTKGSFIKNGKAAYTLSL